MIPRKCFPRGLETKANHSCDYFFQKCSEEYRISEVTNCYLEPYVTNHQNMNAIFIVLSANIDTSTNE